MTPAARLPLLLLFLTFPGCILLGAGLGALLGNPYQGMRTGAYIGALLDNSLSSAPAPLPTPTPQGEQLDAPPARLKEPTPPPPSRRRTAEGWEQTLTPLRSRFPTSRLTPAPPPLEHFVHDLVNEHRLTQGLPPLEFSRELSTIAHVHSRHMASHTTPYGHGGFEDRAKSVSHFMPYRGIAENVAKINGGGEGGEAKSAVAGWLQSPGHRANIEGDFTLTGIGISQSDHGTYYFTQLFMAPAWSEPTQKRSR